MTAETDKDYMRVAQAMDENIHHTYEFSDEAIERETQRQIQKNLEAQDKYRMTQNADDSYFDKMHESQPVAEQLAEEDRINLRDLKESDNELFCFVTEHLVDNWDDFKKLTVMLLNDADDCELGKELRRQKDLALPDYLSSVRKS